MNFKLYIDLYKFIFSVFFMMRIKKYKTYFTLNHISLTTKNVSRLSASFISKTSVSLTLIFLIMNKTAL